MFGSVKKLIAKIFASVALVAAISLGGCTVNIEGLGDLGDYVIDIVGVDGCHHDCGDHGDDHWDD